MTRRAILVLACLAVWAGTMSTALAQDQAAAIEELKKEMRELRQEVNQKQKKIEALEQRLDAVQKTVNATPAKEPVKAATAKTEPATPQAALDQAVKAAQAHQEPGARPDLWSTRMGKATLRLIDISLDVMVAGGSSSATDQQLQNGLQGGGHDPRKRGFTMQQVELSASGAVDPYFNAETHIVYFLDPATGESQFELEEAFFTTQKLPYKLQFKGGTFLTEFGRINPTHPHAWKWLDQPIINTRLFGPDGMRGPGYRVSWLTPLPWYSQIFFGMQNANGSMVSFLSNEGNVADRPIGGYPFTDQPVKTLRDFTYLARVENSWNLCETVTTKLGFSGIYGANYTGPRGNTWIYGTDLVVKWRPAKNYQGWPFLLLERSSWGEPFGRTAASSHQEIQEIPRRKSRSPQPRTPIYPARPSGTGGSTPNCSGASARAGRWGCGVSMPVGVETISHSTPSMIPHRLLAATPIPSGIIAPGSRRC
jgi:uncharacterized coiled-coil protein SlyX